MKPVNYKSKEHIASHTNGEYWEADKMTNQKHTATPWMLEKDGGIRVFTTDGYYEVCRASDMPSITDELSLSEDGGTKEQKANAQFIVRACNAHEELVEALKLTLTPDFNQTIDAHAKSVIWDKIKQALAKAGVS